ncbi:BON domain-containing protein [Lysobacter sp. S4-A87]|uniref:BON domain-containing protein n=1 Tax=Lysobacter sp. S4-A87 TaxID=2925843 RepID=UPI001F530ECA|nr:BON domain-containing protein [Lysobacter sp. S4-A87]UNK48317.1 BON domain-containing protein [Lysobacter sp. S4-A87]
MSEPSARNTLKVVCSIAAAFAAGALAMYLMDPNTGRRRRALIRDRSASLGSDAGHYVRGKARRAAHRLKGVAARGRSSLSSELLDDDRLHDRIRARLGRVVGHPRDVEVHVHDGWVQLKGAVAEEEFEDLLREVSAMRGVRNLESLLRTNSSPGQPEGPRLGPH